MNKRGMNKRGQEVFGMSFSMIFAILLIIFFIAVAFIAINAFLKTQNCAKIGIFTRDLKNRIDEAWNSNDASFEFKGDLPSGITKICFANISESFRGVDKNTIEDVDIYGGENKNFFLYPPAKACDMQSHKILHADLEKITRGNNPYCISVVKGKVIVRIEKENNERLVKIS